MKKTDTGYEMKTYCHDTLGDDYEAVIMETRHAMDIGIFMTELREIEVLRRKPAKLRTNPRFLPSGAKVSYELKIPRFLPQHIQHGINKRKKINERGIYAGRKKRWISLEENFGDLRLGG